MDPFSDRPAKELTPEDRRLRRRFLLDREGITQRQLAEELGCSEGFLSELINGKSRSLEKEKRIADILGVEHSKIFPPPRRGRSGDNDDD